MTATLTHYRPRNPLGAIQATIAIGVCLSVAFVKIHSDQSAKAEVVREYETGRSYIFSKIASAAENHDFRTLNQLQGKYAGSVADSNFTNVMSDALAKASARESQLELQVSKHLDLTRNREEAANRSDPAKSTGQANPQGGQQRLSMLPR